MKIVVDAMGGDNGSKIVVDALIEFTKENPNIEIVVVGDVDELQPLKDVCRIVPSQSQVPMDATALDVMRMKDSSMMIAINTCKEENADAVVSCGSTGGFLSASTLVLKLIPGIRRAALVAPFPTVIKDKKVVILDVGANTENSAEELYQFGYMGRAYAQAVYGIEEPNVFLLNDGTEEGKGAPAYKDAYQLFKGNQFPGFMGNIEARTVLNGLADVVVCDGFAGNVLLKSTEGTARSILGLLNGVFRKNWWTKIGYIHVRKGLRELRARLNYKSTGGAMLLGINKVVVKAHGNSDVESFLGALNAAKLLATNDVVAKIKEGLGIHD